MKKSSNKLRPAFNRSMLLLVSLVVSFAVVELSLRIFYPVYAYAAESQYDRSTSRIWVRSRNSSYERQHPKTGKSHLVYHNNLALRQHRNFDDQAITSAINLGFFGDSFLENLRLPSPYSFNEPLDYLLNTHGKNVNVLNFGIDGYGTDQAFLYYRDFEYSGELDYVFYVFCANDLRNIYENDLFSINADHELVQNQAQNTPRWARLLSRFHTTYAIVDFFNEYSHGKRFHDERANFIEHAIITGLESEDLEKNITIFISLLHLWKQTVEENGGVFSVVLLPRLDEHNARYLFPEEFHVINLYEKFREDIADYKFQDWSFENDGHWNEAANQLVATYLYRELEEKMGLQPISSDKLKKETFTYYSSFEGWMPDGYLLSEVEVDSRKREEVKSKYNSIAKDTH
ncbi:MAG: hypothetical protein O7C75_18445 [Verrucomicrobia bacterium]|nr:hypothetical protein [Verrucomicrobiota bacterium]